MDRGAWQATVHGVARMGYDLVTKPPPYSLTTVLAILFTIYLLRQEKQKQRNKPPKMGLYQTKNLLHNKGNHQQKGK